MRPGWGGSKFLKAPLRIWWTAGSLPRSSARRDRHARMVASSKTPHRPSRDDVTESALTLLDEYGLPDPRARRLATVVGVQPSALYWRFPSTQAPPGAALAKGRTPEGIAEASTAARADDHKVRTFLSGAARVG